MKNLISLFLLISSLIFLSCSGNSGQAQDEKLQDVINPALEKISQQLSKDPDNADLLVKRGKLYYEEEGYDEAIMDFSRAIAVDSNKAEYYHLLADVYLDYYKSYPAIKTMELAASRFPENIPTLLKLAEFQHLLMQYDNSFATLDGILKIDPQNAEAYFMGGMNFKAAGDTILAINSFQSAVEIEPDLVDAWIILGQLYTGLGDRIALQYFDNALRVDSTSLEALHAKAYYYGTRNQKEEAIALYKKIIRINPQYEDAYFNQAIIYMDMDSLDAAIEQFDILIGISPIYIKGYHYRGMAYELKGDYEKARYNYEQALKFAPDYQKALDGLERIRITEKAK